MNLCYPTYAVQSETITTGYKHNSQIHNSIDLHPWNPYSRFRISFIILSLSHAYVLLIKSARQMSKCIVQKLFQLTITAHHARDPRHNTPQERVSINFVLRSIIHVRGRFVSLILLLAVKADIQLAQNRSCRRTYLSIRCLAHAWTPPCWIPRIVS
jgi:hypothetical protein